MKATVVMGIVLLAGLVIVMVFKTSDDEPRIRSSDDVDVSGLREDIRAIRLSLEAIADRLGRERAAFRPTQDGALPGAASDPASAVDADSSELVVSVDALRRAVERQGLETRDALARLSGLRFQSLDQVRKAKAVPDAAALESFLSDFIKDEDAAEKSLSLLSPQEVLARFGPPDRVHDGSLWTWYLPPGEERNPDAAIEIRFGSGYVVGAWGNRLR